MTLSTAFLALPKAELHLHIEGSLEPEMLWSLARRNGVSIPFGSVEAIREAYRFTRLQDFLDIYYQGMGVLLTAQDYEDLAFAYFRRAAEDGIVRAEIFFDPQGHTSRGVALATVMTGLNAAIGRAKAELGLSVGLILCWVIPRPGADDGGTVVAADGGGEANGDVAAGTGGDGAGTSDGTAATLSPAEPASIEGGPDGTAEVAGLLIGEQGPLVEVFEDYVCPFCARLELSAGAQLREAALNGEYRLVVHPIAFLTDDSPRAANASACVYQHESLDTWVAFHEAVYERQDPSESVGQYTNEILVEVAGEVGASSQATTSCIEGGEFEQWVAAITQQAFERGVRGTPTVTVDGTLTDVAPLVQ